MAFQLEKHAGEVLGPYSKGLVSIGLAESLFEKGGNIYKVLELANRGLMETMNGGKFELQFAGAALVARVYLVTGHPGDSVKTLEEIETRAQQRGARRVVRNVRAMQSRIKLWQGPGRGRGPLDGERAPERDPFQCAGTVLLQYLCPGVHGAAAV